MDQIVISRDQWGEARRLAEERRMREAGFEVTTEENYLLRQVQALERIAIALERMIQAVEG